jgi:filamentous hemagglutinin
LQAQIRVRRNPFASGYCVGAKPFSTTESVSGVGNWDEGGANRVALHVAGGALIGGIGGGSAFGAIGGAAGAYVASSAAKGLADIAKGVDSATGSQLIGNLAANVVAGLGGALVGGTAGAASASNVHLYNQSMDDERQLTGESRSSNPLSQSPLDLILLGIANGLSAVFGMPGEPPTTGTQGVLVNSPSAPPLVTGGNTSGYVPSNATLASGSDQQSTGMLGENGPQIASKTIWKGDGSERIDVENPNPGQRPGQIHYQDNQGNKYLYDPTTNSFPDAPNSVNKLLNDPSFNAAIQKGLNKYLGGQ